jgi:hypothetical protein
LLLGNGEKREAGQNRRKTDRPGNQVFSSHLTAPIQPHQKSNGCPQLPFILGRRNSSMGEARADASIASTVARLPQRGGAPQRGFCPLFTGGEGRQGREGRDPPPALISYPHPSKSWQVGARERERAGRKSRPSRPSRPYGPFEPPPTPCRQIRDGLLSWRRSS